VGLLQILFGATSSPHDEVEPLRLASGEDFDIVGEASYQDALDDLCGGKCEDGHSLRVVAQLCFQEDNPYDPDAVVVLVDRQVVGYIPRTQAKRFRSEILRINPQERPVTCEARIVGGWDRGGGDEGHYGVRLSLAEPLTPDPTR
jgi:hypothetical protein